MPSSDAPLRSRDGQEAHQKKDSCPTSSGHGENKRGGSTKTPHPHCDQRRCRRHPKSWRTTEDPLLPARSCPSARRLSHSMRSPSAKFCPPIHFCRGVQQQHAPSEDLGTECLEQALVRSRKLCVRYPLQAIPGLLRRWFLHVIRRRHVFTQVTHIICPSPTPRGCLVVATWMLYRHPALGNQP